MKHIRKYNEVNESLKDFMKNPVKAVKNAVHDRKLEKDYNDNFNRFNSEVKPAIDALKGKGYIKDIRYNGLSMLHSGFLMVDIMITTNDTFQSDMNANIKSKIKNDQLDINVGVNPVYLFLAVGGDEIRASSYKFNAKIPTFEVDNNDIVISKSKNLSSTVYGGGSINGLNNIQSLFTFGSVMSYISSELVSLYNKANYKLGSDQFTDKINEEVLNDIMVDLIDISKSYTISQSGQNPWFVCHFNIDELVVYSESSSDAYTFKKAKFRLNEKMTEVMDILISIQNRLKDIYSNTLVNIDIESNKLSLTILSDDLVKPRSGNYIRKLR